MTIYLLKNNDNDDFHGKTFEKFEKFSYEGNQT